MELLENLPAKQGEHIGVKQCTRKKGSWRCSHWFCASVKWKLCESCRANCARSNKKRLSTDAGREAQKAAQAAYSKKPANLAAHARHRETDTYKSTRSAYWKSEGYRKSRRKYRDSPKGKIALKREDSKILRRLSRSLHQMATNQHPNPKSLLMRNLFASNDDVAEHFRSTYEPWMTDTNHAPHVAGAGYDVCWHIGHRLPVAIYDDAVESDVNKCFDRRNLYAQCARKNIELRDNLIWNDAELLAMRDLWPAAANDSLHKLKQLFPKSVVSEDC